MEEKSLLFSKTMETKIRLNNIQFFGYHGVTDEEKINGQKFEIDVEVCIDSNISHIHDDIQKTNDYCSIYNHVASLFSEKRYNLIEALATKIATTLLKEYNFYESKVVIRKPDVPIEGILDAAEVEVVCHV